MIKLGQKAKDKITDFEGILTARHQYITGCDQYDLTPLKGSKSRDILCFDEGRIKITGKGISIKEITAKEPGGPQTKSTRVR